MTRGRGNGQAEAESGDAFVDVVGWGRDVDDRVACALREEPIVGLGRGQCHGPKPGVGSIRRGQGHLGVSGSGGQYCALG